MVVFLEEHHQSFQDTLLLLVRGRCGGVRVINKARISGWGYNVALADLVEPGMEQGFGESATVAGIGLDQRAAQVAEVVREVPGKGQALSRDDVQESCRRGLARERETPRRECKDEDPGGEGVDLVSKVRLVSQDFGRGIVQGATVPGQGLVAVEGRRHAPIGDQRDGAFGVLEEQVLQLDVAMADALRVSKLHGLEDLPRHVLEPIFGHRALLHEREPIPAFGKIQVEKPEIPSHVEPIKVEADDIRVLAEDFKRVKLRPKKRH